MGTKDCRECQKREMCHVAEREENKDVFLSIIVPIYKVEKDLGYCVDSIMAQIHQNMEIILVDDGSPDDCPQICDEYAIRDERIKTYHKINGGLSDARNYGLKHAQGQYVMFVDSDDFLLSGSLDSILHSLELNDVDILLLDAIYVDESGKKISKPDFVFKHVGLNNAVIYSGEESIKRQLEAGMFQTVVWLGVYRKDFLIDNQLWFQKGLLHEDELWTPITLIVAASVIYEPIELYAYRCRPQSIMQSEKKDRSKNIAAIIYIYSFLVNFYEWRIRDKNLLNILLDDVARRYLHAISLWRFSDFPKLMKRVNRWKIFRCSKTTKNKLRALLLLINSKLYSKICNEICGFHFLKNSINSLEDTFKNEKRKKDVFI